jgi:uncharacterized protein (TIGR00369 family)
VIVAAPRQATGQTMLNRLSSELQRPPFNRWLGVRAIGVDEGRREAVVALPFRPEFSYDATRAVFHGGVVASLIDLTGYASAAIWSVGPTPTLSLQIDFLAPATGDELIARGIVRRSGRTVSRVDVEVTVAGELVALGRGAFFSGGGA